MNHSFKLSRRMARHRASALVAALLTAAACNSSDTFNPDTSSTLPTPPEAGAPEEGALDAGAPEEGAPEAGSAEELQALAPSDSPVASAFAGGIPMGLFHLPSSGVGSRYNGVLLTAGPGYLMRDLAAIKARGGKVVLNLSGSQRYFKDSRGHFSLTKWKERVARFRNIRFSSYINDGTIVGHYLIDEPYDAHNFGGQAVKGATLEAMGQYSKGIWPGLVTIVRAEPYLIQWSGRYNHVDAAWAQYLYRKGNVRDYIAKNVSYAQRMGLGLVVGLNIRDGGTGNRVMTASQVQDWGSTLIGNSYSCAFISWKYGDSYLNSGSMKTAMDALRRKAQSRGGRSCRG